MITGNEQEKTAEQPPSDDQHVAPGCRLFSNPALLRPIGEGEQTRATMEDAKAADAYVDSQFAAGMRPTLHVVFLAGIAYERARRPAETTEDARDLTVVVGDFVMGVQIRHGDDAIDADRFCEDKVDAFLSGFNYAREVISEALRSHPAVVAAAARRPAAPEPATEEVEQLRAKVAVAEAWGLTFGLMKSSDRPDPYWLADVREGSDIARMQEAVSDLIVVEAESRRLAGEVERLRTLLAFAYAGPALYRDDGELQDGRAHPTIDFRRDSVDEIERKMGDRASVALAPVPQQEKRT